MNRLARRFLIVALLNVLNSYGQTNNACSNNEDIAVLEIQLDQNADETGYNLVCDDVTIWDVPIGALKDQPAGAWKIERSCIRSHITLCNFTISDAGRDGITGSENGFFSLSYGATTVAYLDYGKAAPFTEHSFCFGTGCDSPAIEQKEDDEIKDGWKIVDFNDTTVPPSSSPAPEEDGSNFAASGVWVVNVTKINKDEGENERDDSGHWVVNVTVIEKEDDPIVEPKNTTTPNVKTIPNTNDQPMSKSDSNSPSTSSLAIIAGIIGSIMMGILVLCILYKRSYRGRDTSNDTVGAVLPYAYNASGINNKNDNDDDDEKSKNSNHNDKVQPAETFVTYDSSDTTVVQPV